ncbi:VOC family protein [Aliihoeflea aestuarii]|jgi:catechol 2,3-dioxygenase-like lactoylglutathione lyase family enzyme|uniref:VOC family protein n=1 Tax=Aliihoeflea aestuarii TaxID=453840 RepID=UPI0020922065|nr:VOC family protein [Aliihoeflea aestuarii]MCO6391130.1 VOC family protein [Aliihoeflea aestuarii]
MRLATITLVVDDYDRAIAHYVDVFGFRLLEDTRLDAGKRWVRVAPHKDGPAFLLAEAADGDQRAAIGRQTGGRVSFFIETDDFDRDHASMLARGTNFIEAPRVEPYGKVAVFADLYGNLFDLIEPRRKA